MVKTNNPATTDPKNPSTTGNAGTIEGKVPEALADIAPNADTADNKNDLPKTQGNQINNNQNQTTVVQNPSQKKGKPPIKSIHFKTKFLDILITDPNILDELNTEGKYASDIPFEALEIHVNTKGGRYYIKTQDRKEVSREIVSGVARAETEAIELFKCDRTVEPVPANPQ